MDMQSNKHNKTKIDLRLTIERSHSGNNGNNNKILQLIIILLKIVLFGVGLYTYLPKGLLILNFV